ncbi:hypothetical protein HBB16_10385 [Pseudonocardia sp. MCCB 268]|nr:hypothetical protein [Pseudonocardia cytotoxica]
MSAARRGRLDELSVPAKPLRQRTLSSPATTTRSSPLLNGHLLAALFIPRARLHRLPRRPPRAGVWPEPSPGDRRVPSAPHRPRSTPTPSEGHQAPTCRWASVMPWAPTTSSSGTSSPPTSSATSDPGAPVRRRRGPAHHQRVLGCRAVPWLMVEKLGRPGYTATASRVRLPGHGSARPGWSPWSSPAVTAAWARSSVCRRAWPCGRSLTAPSSWCGTPMGA